MKTALIRGQYLNRFEGQNYEPIAKKAGITAITPDEGIDKKDLAKVKELFSAVGEVVEVKESEHKK